MTTEDEEVAWRAEFERLGELLVYDSVKQGAMDERKRQAAFRWLAGEAAKRRAREVGTLRIAMWTLVAAGAAVVVGVVGVVVTLLHR